MKDSTRCKRVKKIIPIIDQAAPERDCVNEWNIAQDPRESNKIPINNRMANVYRYAKAY